MTNLIAKNIGSKVRFFRKKRGMTLQELADAISKSRATVSKYENGEIIIDIVTLYEIAAALDIEVDQLLYVPEKPKDISGSDAIPAFFKDLSRIYTYRFDGRNNTLLRGVIDISTRIQENTYKAMFYLNIKSFEEYQQCQNTYVGKVRFFNTLTRFELENQDSPAELNVINVLNAFADSATKWAMVTSISSHPLMPCSSKTLLSKKQIPETEDFLKSVTLNKEDIRLMKLYNMFVVPG